MTVSLRDIQQRVGAIPDGLWGPATADAIWAALPIEHVTAFNRDAFLGRFVNRRAAAITEADAALAAHTLDVTPAHIRMVSRVESGPYGGFDNKGRPVILPEPHIFARQTGGRYTAEHPTISSRVWNRALYPRSFDGRWDMLAGMAALDEAAALESASWGRFQIMGFHWQSLGYLSVHAMTGSMVASEAGHMDAMVRFVRVNGMADDLRACRAGQPETCRAFARRYNGSAYAANSYHVRMAEALS